MANNKVTIDLQIASQGMDPAVGKSQAIRDNLTAAGSAMNRVGGGTAGSRAVSQKAAGQEYSAQRAVAGATGASARNFAAESQGLGGLVRLYATVAANTYAATAAFTALSRAMDTTNMVQGLNQLGAASGKNLGTLSKELTAVTNGAISIRESMQAVTQMSAAGMGSENILKLGKVAEKASQALGINMSDAVNRLSRGITKLEPELLDELGIFTKIDESNRNYAASLGKSVSALTDFEKRQGFANAVLEEGNKKFGEIKIDTNPYAKLLASLQNLTQSGLELVNKVLGPLVSMLAESPVALAGILAGIGGLLVSKALPALGSWREGLKDAAAQAADASNKIRQSFGDDFQDKLEAHFKIPDLKQTIKDTERQLTALSKIPAPTVAPTPTKLTRVASAVTTDVDTKALTGVNKLISDRQLIVDTGMVKDKQASAARIAAAQEEIKWLKTKAEYIEREIQQNQVLERQNKAKLQLTEAQLKLQNKADLPLTRTDPETVAIMAAEKARRRYDVLEATSAAANTANIAGIRVAWAELNKTIEDKGITGLSKWTTLARGGIAAVASRVVGLVGSFGAVGQALAVVSATAIAAFEILDSWLSINSKQAKEAATALDALGTSAKFIDDVLENISKKDPLASISTQSITARATAINDLATNTATAFDKLKDTVDRANWWDKFIDGWKTVIGKDLLTVSAKQFSTGIAQQLKAATPGKEKTKAVQGIKDILGVDPQDVEAVNRLLSESPEKLMQLMPQVSAVMKQFGHEVMNVASQGQQLDDAFTNASKTLDSILVAAIPTDPLAKLGLQTITISQEMAKAFDDPITALNQMAKIANDISKLRFLGNFGEQIQKLGPELKKTAENIANLTNQLNKLDEEEAAVNIRRKELTRQRIDPNYAIQEGFASPKELLTKREKLTTALDVETKKIQPAQELFLKAQSESFLLGAKYIESSIGAGFKQAAITVQSAYAALLGDTAGGIELRASLQKQSIDVQSSQIRATGFLIDSQEKLRLAAEDQTDAIRKASLEGEAGNKLAPGERDKQLKEIEARIIARKELPTELANTPAGKQIGLLKSYAQGSSLVGPLSQNEEITSKARSEVAAGAASAIFAKQGINAQTAQKAAEKQSIEIQKQQALLQNELKIRQEILAIDAYILETAKSTFDSQLSVLPYLSEDQLARKNGLDYAILMNKQLQERNVLETELQKIDKVINESKDAEAVDRAKESREEVLQRQQRLGIKQLNDEERAREKNRVEGIQNIKKKEFERLDVTKVISDTQVAQEQTLYTIKSENIAKLNALGALSPERMAAAQQELDLEAEKFRSAEKLAELKDKQARASADFTARRTTAAASGDTTAIDAAQTASDAAYQSALANEARLTAARQGNIAVIGASNILLAQQKATMDSLVLTTESLATVFGTVGTAIGNLAQIMQSSADTEKQNLTARIALEQELFNAKKPEDIAKAEKGLSDLEKKSAKDKQNADLATLNSTKKLFKEKTAAYKALDAIEKVQHVRRIFESNKELITSVMNAGKELAQKLGFMATEETAQVSFRASEIAGTAAANTANATSAIPAIFAKFSAMMGPWGWAAAAAVVAALGLSGGSSSPPGGFTAEDQQKVQGTGQTYENGKLVDRAGGVLGDRTAKAKSVGDSIDELGKVFFEVLGSDSSKMLGYLRGIEENTLGLAKALMGSSGILGNKPLGISESSSGSGLAGFIFGKSSTTIADQGLEISGGLEKLSEGIGSFSTYVNTVRKSSGFLGFGGSTSYNTARGKVEDTAVDAIAKIFKNVTGVLVSAADALEGSGTRVSDVLRDIPIKIKASAKDLSAKEFAEAVQAEVSVALNAAAEKAFPYMSEYVKVGEEYWTTVARIVKEGEVLNQGLKMIGLSMIEAASGTTGMEAAAISVAAQQNLIKQFGGDLDAATSSIQFYFDNFLTEQQRGTYYTEQLTTGFKDMGLATVPTLDQFTKMVAGLDANDAAQANTLASLLKLAPAYDRLRQAQEKTANLQEAVWELEGKGALALEARRARELKSMTDTDAAIQRRINALEDEKTAYDKLKSALKDTVDAIKTSVVSLRDFQASVLTGTGSLISPGEKLAVQRSEFDKAIEAAKGPRTTADERKLADTAAQNVVKFGQQLLSTGDTLFASSKANEDLRAYVASQTGTVADKLELAQTDAEKTVTELENSNGYLKTIDKSIGDLLQEYKDARTAAIKTDPNIPQKTIGPLITNGAPAGTASDVVTALQLQIAVQKETNKIQQEQLEVQKAQLTSNAIAIKTQTDQLAAAAEERRLADEYALRNQPDYATKESS